MGVSAVYRGSPAFVEAHRSRDDVGEIEWVQPSTSTTTHYVVLSADWDKHAGTKDLDSFIESIDSSLEEQNISMTNWGTRSRDGLEVVALQIES